MLLCADRWRLYGSLSEGANRLREGFWHLGRGWLAEAGGGTFLAIDDFMKGDCKKVRIFNCMIYR